MSEFSSRLLSFANSSVLLEYHGPQATKLVNFLYDDIPAESAVEPHLTFRLFDTPKGLQARRAQSLLYEGPSEAVAAEHLLGDTCYHLADKSGGGLLFHAAGLSRNERGLLLPGATSAGKTTLTAWLLKRGFSYLTDELVFVPTEKRRMHTFTRPLNLKKPSRAVLQPYLDFEKHADDILSSEHADLVPPRLLGSVDPVTTPPLRIVIFPQYHPLQSELSLKPLSAAQIGLELMKYLINARNLPGYGFATVTRLARTISGYKVRYSNFAQLGHQLEAFFEETPI